MDDPSAPPLWQRPARRARGRVVAGVAAGVADELGVDPFVVRVAFVVLAAAGGWGVVLYAIAWVLMELPGRPREPVGRVPKGADPHQRLLGIGAVVFGLLFAARAVDLVFLDALVWPTALFGAGLAVAHAQGVAMAASPVPADRRSLVGRVVAGAFLVVAAVVLAVSLSFDLGDVAGTLVVLGVLLAGLTLVTAPWVAGMVEDLSRERNARIRADERAEVAAHLHDSVLQTLSLIQRRSTDAQVVGLARRQERELRSWLYGRRSEDGGDSFAARLESELADVESLHGVPVEVVVVGDGPVDDAGRALLAAAREAVTNAAVHSGAARIDVFAEVRHGTLDVYVRDTGCGFDPAAVPEDRRGIASSIRERLARVGGRVEIVSEPGAGTEVEMHVGGGGR